MNLPVGKLVAFEGIDNAGKTTIIGKVAEQLTGCKAGIIQLGERMSPVKDAITDLDLKELSAFQKTFLFAADRAWIYEKECVPALERGEIVLWDRYVDSAIVYRFVDLSNMDNSDGLDVDFVVSINKLFRKPDITFLINISVGESLKRAKKSWENEPYNQAFLEKARKKYMELARQEHYIIIEGEATEESISSEIVNTIRRKFKNIL